MNTTTKLSWLIHPAAFAATLLLVVLAGLTAPREQTLGANLGLILVHGAWAWCGQIVFGLAALAGLLALALRRPLWQRLTLILGRSGLAFWLTYLPLALLVMQLNWGGLFLDEPRWRIPFTFGVVGVLLQIGLTLTNRPQITAAANLAFGLALWWALRSAGNVLHPEAPIGSEAGSIPLVFAVLLGLALLLAAQFSLWQWRRLTGAADEAQ